MRRFPLRLRDGELAVLQPKAGIVLADRALRAFLRGIRVEERRVASLSKVDEPVVVVTAGSWARGLLAEVGIDLPVRATRETVAYFRLESELPVPSVAKLRPASVSMSWVTITQAEYPSGQNQTNGIFWTRWERSERASNSSKMFSTVRSTGQLGNEMPFQSLR